MSEYKSLDWFFIRSAFLSHEEGEAFFKSPLSALENPLISKVMSTASPDLYQELMKEGDKSEVLKTALLNTLTRMTYRSIPFSYYAGISFGESGGNDSEIYFKKKEEYLASLRPKITAVETNEVIINPTLVFAGELAKFIRPLKTKDSLEQKAGYHYSFVSIPEELIKKIKNDPNSLGPKIKDHLLSIGVLWSKKKFLKTKTEILPILESKENTSTHLTELFKPTQKATLSSGAVHSILKGAEVIIDLFRPDTNLLDLIKSDFYQKYEGQSAPLLELLLPDNTIGRKFAEVIERELTPQKNLDFETLLIELILSQEVQESRVLKLTNKHLESFKKIKFTDATPDAFSVVAEMVVLNETDKKYNIKYLKGPHAIGHFARYLNLDSELKKKIKKLSKEEMNLRPDAIFAELIHKADMPGLTNVMPQTDLYEASISISMEGSAKNEIPLSDLMVSLENNVFKLTSKSLNREVMPVVANLYNYQLDGHPIYQFLACLEAQNSFSALNWSWGFQSKFPHLPRVEYKNLILFPERWRLTKEMSEKFQKKDISLFEVRSILKEYKFPDIIELVEKGATNRRFNISDDASLRSLMKFLTSGASYFFQETFTPSGVEGPEGIYSHDIIIPFVRNKPVSKKTIVKKNKEVKEKDRVFPPGSSWNYIDIYLSPTEAPLVLRDYVQIFAKRLSTPWFYIQYADPEFHIRLRGSGDKLDKFIKFGQKLVDAGLSSHFNVRTYKREIERYGGLKGCVLFEKLSQNDSEAALKFFELGRNSQISPVDLWILAAMTSVKIYLKSFNLSERDSSEFLQNDLMVMPKISNVGEIKKRLHRFKQGNLYEDERLILEKIYEERFKKDKLLFKNLENLFSKGEMTVTKKSYFRSLTHISLVRMNLDLDRSYEYFIFETLDQILKYRKAF